MLGIRWNRWAITKLEPSRVRRVKICTEGPGGWPGFPHSEISHSWLSSVISNDYKGNERRKHRRLMQFPVAAFDSIWLDSARLEGDNRRVVRKY